MSFETGQILKHKALPELGRARVEAVVADNIHLLFELSGGGESKVFRLPNEHLILAGDQSNQGFPQLKAVKAAKSKRSKSAPKAAKSSKAWSFEDAWKRFEAKYPAGFSDAKYQTKERGFKAAAMERSQEAFGPASVAKLQASGSPAEVEKAFAKAYEGLTLLHAIEWLQFRKGLHEDPASVKLVEQYAAAIAEGGLSESRFNGLLNAFEAAGLGKGKWTLFTLWPSLATSKGFLFLKPEITKTAAVGMGVELHYDAKPNFATYHAALTLYEKLWALLEPKGAKDWTDVQAFIWTGWS